MNKEPKQKRCLVCREPFTPKRIGLKVTKVCLNAGCVLDWAQGVRAKDAEKAARKAKREYYSNDLPTLKKKAQVVFNKYIRLRDNDLGCISCDKDRHWDGQWHAGHFRTTGANSHLRFHPVNVNKQCSVCNNYLSGNLANYAVSIVDKWGLFEVACLERYATQPEKPTAEFYNEIISFYSAQIKLLDCKAK